MIKFFEKILNNNSSTGNTYRTSKSITEFVEAMLPELTQNLQDEKMLKLMRVDNIFDKRQKPNTKMSKAECAYCTNKILTTKNIIQEGYKNYEKHYEEYIEPELFKYIDLICAGGSDEKKFEEIQEFYTAKTLKKYLDDAVGIAHENTDVIEENIENTKKTMIPYLNYARGVVLASIELAVLCDVCPKFDFYGFEK